MILRLRLGLARLLRRLADRMTPPTDAVVLLVPRDLLFLRACDVVARIDREETTATWQNKWHQATGRLVHDFPDRSARDVTRAIEAAIQERP